MNIENENLIVLFIYSIFNITATADVAPSPDPSRELQAPASQRESGESDSLESFERPKDLAELYQNLFSEEQMAASKFHYYWKCTESGCSEISFKEKARIKQMKKQDMFQHNWLLKQTYSFTPSVKMWWTVYVEGEGIYCILCKKHCCKSKINEILYTSQEQDSRQGHWKPMEKVKCTKLQQLLN